MKEENAEFLHDVLQDFWQEIEQDKELPERKKKIMQAAIKLFAEKGYHSSSTSEIAKEAGVAEGTIFRHFKSKKDILIALVAPVIIRMASPLFLKDVRKIMQSDVPSEKLLQDVYHNRLDLVEKNWRQFRILIQEMQFHPEIRDAVVASFLRPGRELGEDFVKSRIASGEFKDYPPTSIFRTFISMLIGYIVFNHLVFPEEGKELDREQEVAMMTDILLNGLRK